MQKPSPEVDQFIFAPRVKTPVLMLNGRYDFVYSPDSAQEPMYRIARYTQGTQAPRGLRHWPRHTEGRVDQGNAELAGSVSWTREIAAVTIRIGANRMLQLNVERESR
jgi:hypothetical protein